MITLDFSNKNLAKCLNFMIGLILMRNTTKNVVLIDVNVDLDIPSTKYKNLEDAFLSYSDLETNVYISRSTLEDVERILNKTMPAPHYDPKARLILVSDEKSGFSASTSHHFSEMIFVEETSVCSDSFKYEVVKKKSEDISHINICVNGYWPPYTICTECKKNKGINIDILQTFVAFSNLSSSFFNCDSKNKSYIQCVANDFCNSHCDVAQCDVCLKSQIQGEKNVDYVLYLLDEYDFWFVPRSGEIPNWKFVILAIPEEVWIVWLITTMVASLSIWYAIKITSTMRKKPIKVPLTVVLRMTIKFFMDIPEQYRVETLSKMMVLTVILFAGIILNVYYKARYTYALLGPNFYKQHLETVYDAHDKNMLVTYSPHLRNDLEHIYPDIKDYFTTHYVKSDECQWFDLVTGRRDVIALKAGLTAKYEEKIHLQRNGRSLIQVLKEPVKRSVFGFVFSKGHPVLSKMAFFMNRLRDHGFLNMIIAKYDSIRYKLGSEVYQRRKLNLKDIEGPLLVICLGTLLSVMVFIYELSRR